MNTRRASAIVLRQFYLMRGSPVRIMPTFAWSKPFSIPGAAGMQLLFQIRNSPSALALDASQLLTVTQCDERPSLSTRLGICQSH